MSFVSVAFLCLVPATFLLYHATSRLPVQNLIILTASYVFYGWWDWRFLPLLIGISIVNYAAAILIAATPHEHTRKLLVFSAVAAAMLVLAIFKYFNFFVDSFATLAQRAGLRANLPTLHIVLPLGISFITFQGIAYVVDVYRGRHVAERSLVKFLAFKAFFPQLVAGPIERASNLLDQFSKPRQFTADHAERALWLLIYGYAMKIVVADSLAVIVDTLFIPDQPFGWSVVLATIAFGIQIYADFNGYSLIAKGVALLFGFELIWNFRYPYWSVSISEFWRRWHISLSTWLRDYLYIPLGGNRHGAAITNRNLMLTMALGGLWHGASWTFVLWGLLHGAALALWRRVPDGDAPSSKVARAAGWAVTMLVVFVGWFLFRAANWTLLVGMLSALANWEWAPVHSAIVLAILSLAGPLMLLEWQLKLRGDYFLLRRPAWMRYPLFAALAAVTIAASGHVNATFIYFQF
ncbi:membrane-bound O-acyltransferase family protein [Bradyrhizobium sp. WBOS7]|uniref:Probable alginate O-acetylase AlgI n=1 Tax=Bradyrhizobium betae TaxID=244734 RepID=A0AAE9N5P9_9BRAD|nr:membrane-bound O-acyltransferase family protein [Bradyrhizobium sp. WBOS2]MDD1572410.1 membrane-bound O-acyltransferase family protein [Bradyrhizobium sp. WBOS1]MDD1577404.1 membrane-bound O-acyltransferase family protein [Bradyrhizobium sp. WBOS7]MDD1602681.1 membrane-bound O-acyltransferase family protein [Bradyrhizobium sp. WBOS16]UUO34196.1 membrane-bound O-acyltransferase family protein [Bradyrhizobium sp. WBOS01]UUO40628.1 membrane-bound O-acyltransferase family protein [Bradyrhizobiu